MKQKNKLINDKIDLTKVSFNFTSIMDSSVYQAFSKVIQKILPCTPYLCKLLNKMANYCKISKLFIYDIVTKLVIAHND